MKKQEKLYFYTLKNLSMKARNITKRAYQQFIMNRAGSKQLIFVVGCQRSGTTMLMNSFRRDFRTNVYGETKLSDKNTYRLKPYDEIERIIARDKASLIISKPLVESQNVLKLLDYFQGAKAIWVYRHFKGVVNSSTIKFGAESTRENLRSIICRSAHWAAEGVSENTQAIVLKHFSEGMPLSDGKALFWYVRNILFFEQNLDDNPNVLLCRYEDIAAKPDQMIRCIYRFLDLDYPGDHIIKHIHSRSVNLGQHLNINREIEDLCTNLLHRMDKIVSTN